MQRRLLWLNLVVFLLFFQAVAAAQTTTGSIAGTVKDSSGAVVPNAAITLKNLDTGDTRRAVTDASGRYTAPQLRLGRYEVSAEAAGFQSAIRTGIEMTVGRDATLDFTLQVGAVSEKVTVTG